MHGPRSRDRPRGTSRSFPVLFPPISGTLSTTTCPDAIHLSNQPDLSIVDTVLPCRPSNIHPSADTRQIHEPLLMRTDAVARPSLRQLWSNLELALSPSWSLRRQPDEEFHPRYLGSPPTTCGYQHSPGSIWQHRIQLLRVHNERHRSSPFTRSQDL